MIDDPATTCTPHPPPIADGKPRPFDPAWRTETVLALAKGIEAESAFDRLPILADALEEAGCDDEVLLRHCRGCEWHEEECWALSLALTEHESSQEEPFSYLPPHATREVWRNLGFEIGGRRLHHWLNVMSVVAIAFLCILMLIAQLLGLY